MKVLLSAYACEPGKGSEPEAGFRTLLAAASAHDVWVLTRENNVASLERALSESPVRNRVRIVGLDLGRASRVFKRWRGIGLHGYYDRWQRSAGTAAQRLHDEVGFDVAHHVTFASYWGRIGIGDLDVPLVVGPIGGGVKTPPRLIPVLGLRGLGAEVARNLARVVLSRGQARTALRRARVVLVQNAATAHRIGRPGDAITLPNALAVRTPGLVERSTQRNEIAYVGRLIPWKAPILAVRALHHLRRDDVVLRIYGSGSQRSRVERAALRWGVSSRVVFEGHVDREELHQRLAQASVLLHPALHEEAGFAVAEALAIGTPVACLAHGGPAELLRHWPHVPSRSVAPGWPQATAQALADAVEELLDVDLPAGETALPPTVDYQGAILAAYERARTPQATDVATGP